MIKIVVKSIEYMKLIEFSTANRMNKENIDVSKKCHSFIGKVPYNGYDYKI